MILRSKSLTEQKMRGKALPVKGMATPRLNETAVARAIIVIRLK
jgi:hypothetical protein